MKIKNLFLYSALTSCMIFSAASCNKNDESSSSSKQESSSISSEIVESSAENSSAGISPELSAFTKSDWDAALSVSAFTNATFDMYLNVEEDAEIDSLTVSESVSYNGNLAKITVYTLNDAIATPIVVYADKINSMRHDVYDGVWYYQSADTTAFFNPQIVFENYLELYSSFHVSKGADSYIADLDMLNLAGLKIVFNFDIEKKLTQYTSYIKLDDGSITVTIYKISGYGKATFDLPANAKPIKELPPSTSDDSSTTENA